MVSAFLFVILRLPSLFEPYWYGDEGIYLVLGQAIRKGLTLYSQIHDNKPPTLYYLAAFAQTVFGFRLLLLVSIAIAVFFFYKLAKKLLPPRLVRSSTIFFIILTSIPLFEGNIANAEVFMLLPTIAGIYYFLYSGSKNKYLYTGLLLGMAFTIKIPVFIELVFLCLWLMLTQYNHQKFKLIIRNLLFLIAGFAAPFLLYAVWYIFNGTFSDFIFAAILQNFGYLSSWATGSHSGSATNGGLITRGLILLIFWGVIVYLYLKKYLDKSFAFIFLWLSASVFGALLSTRPYPHYLIQILPSLCLLLPLAFSRTISIRLRVFIIVFFIFITSLFFKYRFYVYPVFSYYRNFYTHIFSLNSYTYRNYFGQNVDNSYQIADYLKRSTPPGDPIFIWGDEPYIYALSNRLPVGRFTVAYHIADFNQYDQVYSKLTAVMPDTIVYFPQENRPYLQLEELLSNYYYPATGFGNAVIYHRLP